ncbi:MAG TPA: ABC transporter transmembrane domain-containing protein, partial [Puia sp.]|nr:ABC transporter transmembrane domain-containing protein [Puia sp.]
MSEKNEKLPSGGKAARPEVATLGSAPPERPGKPKGPGLFSVLRPYRRMIFLLVLLSLLSNGINLAIPNISRHAIDDFVGNHLDVARTIGLFLAAAIGVFVFTYGVSYVQTYTSEKVARDLRTKLATKISRQNYQFLQKSNPAQLLTNLTADVDSVKGFVAQAIASIFSSIFIIVGASVMLLTIRWQLALCVIGIIPIISFTFMIVLKKVRALFKAAREVIDALNKVINESILGAALIRVIHSMHLEYHKFLEANARALGLGLRMLKLFATLIPVIIFSANLATLTILGLGGHYVIGGRMTLGDFMAFNSYLTMLIFPILVIGFMSNVIAQAQASYGRIAGVLHAPDPEEKGTIVSELRGEIAFRDVSVRYGEKQVLRDISFHIRAG